MNFEQRLVKDLSAYRKELLVELRGIEAALRALNFRETKPTYGPKKQVSVHVGEGITKEAVILPNGRADSGSGDLL